MNDIDLNSISINKEDIFSYMTPFIKSICESISREVLKEIGDGAYAAAQKWFFWNTALFKEFMTEQLKKTINDSMKIVFEDWLKTRLREKDLEVLFEGMAKKFITDEQLRKILTLEPKTLPGKNKKKDRKNECRM